MRMIALRAKLEQALGMQITDTAWTSISTPADLIHIIATGESSATGTAARAPAVERRAYRLNMPQMALGGMSESWLFKEIGDIHWSIITTALEMPSSRLTDGRAIVYTPRSRDSG